MTSRNSFLPFFTLILFYLVSKTSAFLPETDFPVPETCERVAIGTAVDCGCFLYQPLYESNPIWRGLENLCSEELSGDIAAGNSSCQSAPFHVPSTAPESVQIASIEAADRFFKAVERYCIRFIDAEGKLKRADLQLAEANTTAEVKRARLAKQSAFQEKRDARAGLKIARDRRYRHIQHARRKEWPPGRLKEYREKQRQAHLQELASSSAHLSSRYSSSTTPSTHPLSTVVSLFLKVHQIKAISEGRSSDFRMQRRASPLKILSAVRRLDPSPKLTTFCVVVATYEGLPKEKVAEICNTKSR